MAKGAALFALVQTIKWSGPAGGDERGRPGGRRRSPPLGLTVAEVAENWRARGWPPWCPALRVGDRRPRPGGKTDPVTPADQDLSPAAGQHAAARRDRTGTFNTYDNQRVVMIEIGNRRVSSPQATSADNQKIGEGMLTDLPPRPAGAPFQVVFHMTDTGLLKVHGWEPRSGSEVRFEIQIGRLDEEQTRQATSTVTSYDVSG